MPIDTMEREPDDLRETIAAQFETDTGAPEAPEVVSEPSEPVEPELALEEPKGDHPTDPARYADGTFKPTKTEAAPEKAAPVKEPISPAKDATKASEPAVSTPQDAPPVGWPADAKAEWSKLSPAVKAAALKRETEIANGGKQWSEEKRRYEGLLTPVAQEAAQLGIGVEQGLQALINTHRAIRANPEQTLRAMARHYGVNLESSAGSQRPAEGSQDQPQIPDISALVQHQVQQALAPIAQRWENEDRTRNLTIVEQFAEAHPHFEAASDAIMAMLPGIKAANPMKSQEQWLDMAYNAAVFGNEEMRNSIFASRDQEAEQRRIAQAKQKLTASRLASSSVTGSPSAAAQEAPRDSIRAEIEAAFDSR